MAETEDNVEPTEAEDTAAEATEAPAAEPTEAASAPAADPAPAAEPAQAAEPQPVPTPKERRQAGRAAKAPAPRGPVSPEDRQAERVAARAHKAALRRTGRVKAREKNRAAEHRSEPTPPREHAPGTQKVRQGIVVSDKADKTITVRIDLARRHRKYQKIVATSTKVHAHDETNDANVGDTVVVRECRPLSRSKRWRLVEVVERAK